MGDLAERSVIGSLLIDIQSIQKVYNILKPEMFRNELRGAVYKEIVKAYDIGEMVNLVTLMQSLEGQNFTREIVGKEVQGCVVGTPTSVQIKSYAENIIKDYKAHVAREILKTNIQPAVVEEQITELIQDLEALKQSEKNKAKKLTDIVNEYQGLYFKERTIERLNMGFEKLDDVTGGLEGGDVIVIGARPGVGKSAFVSQVIIQMAERSKRVGFYNLEMSDKQVYERLLSNVSGIGLKRIRRSVSFLGDEKERFTQANNALGKLNILISSGTKTVEQIRHECRHQELDCIVIDYLQLVRSDRRYQNRTSEVGEISKSIKALAMELNIPIIALSQLNRSSEQKSSKEPTMAELREAGDIEQDASIIMLLWNVGPEENARKALKVDKNRQGELCKIVYEFDGSRMKFIETAEEVPSGGDGFRPAPKETPFD